MHVGNAFGELFARQGHLGAMPATVNDGLWGTPASRHEAACASGSVAALAAIADLRSGAYRSALVVGVELEKTVPGDTAAQHLGAAAWTGHEGADAKFMWPHMFDQVADEYDRRYGLDETHLRAIAALNFANARTNPNAQTRDWTVPDPLDRRRRAQPGRRGPAAPLRLQPDHRRRRGRRPRHRRVAARPSRVRGRSGGSTAGATAPSGWACSRSSTAPPTIRTCMPHVRRAVLDAFDRAHVTLDDVDGFEVHDCFTPSEYLAIDHIGLTGPGESGRRSRTARSRSAGGCRSTPAAG